MDHVRRILSGHPLYVEPSMEFTPYIYTPLYFHVSSIAARILGTGFTALRLVSVLSFLGCLVILFQLVRRESGSMLGGVLAAGLYAATYEESGSWFDLARVDSLFMLLVLLGIHIVRRKEDLAHQTLAGIVFFLAFLTKQTALVIALPLCAYTILGLRGWLRIVFPSVVAVLVLTSTVAMNMSSDGWYTYYVFSLPGQHAIRTEMLLDFWLYDLLEPLAVALAISLLTIAWLASRRRYRDLLFHACLFAGMVGASWSSRLHVGGWYNSLMPAHAALAVLFGLGIASLGDGRAGEPVFEPLSPRVRVFAVVVGLAQLLSLVYSPAARIPSREDAEAGWSLVRVMSRFEGPVYLPNHGYLPTLAGKETTSPGMAANDVLRGRKGKIKDGLHDDIRSAIRRKQFDAVITNERGMMEGWMEDELERHYEFRGDIFTDKDVFWHVEGHSMRPQHVYVRRE